MKPEEVTQAFNNIDSLVKIANASRQDHGIVVNDMQRLEQYIRELEKQVADLKTKKGK